MGIREEDVRWVIRETLKPIDLYTQDIEELLVATAAHESHLGYYLKQNGGPALGIYQMEPLTEKDLWVNFIFYRKDLSKKLNKYRILSLSTDLAYQTVMARVQYLRASGSIPNRNDIEGIALYWKVWWNTSAGKGTIDEFISNYKKFIKQGLK